MDVLGHVDELVEIHLQTRARLVRANLAMADDMIAIARDRPSSANGLNQTGTGLVQRVGPGAVFCPFVLNSDRIPIGVYVGLQ